MTLANLNLKSILTDSTKQKQVIVIGVGLVISYYGFGIVKGAVKKRQTKQKIAKRRNEISNEISALKNELKVWENGQHVLITKERKQILDMDIQTLLTALRDGQVKPVQALEAYQAKSLEVTEKKNCVCFYLKEAKEMALKLEKVPMSKRGPLYGLPMSLKECFHIKGYDSTAGLSCFLNKPHTRDGAVAGRLKELGAVPFCKTNVPQTMETYGTSNPIFGTTLNPWDDLRTPGGSSGGEACLIARGGSILGFGTDGGGSLRTPSHFSGIVTIKPTVGRIMKRGLNSGNKGDTVGIYGNAGFMSPNVEGLIVGMKALLDDPWPMTKWDFQVAPLKWNQNLFDPKRKLRIGWYDYDGVMEATPGVKRGVHETVKMLESSGHTLIHFPPERFHQLMDIYYHHAMADNGTNSLEYLQHDVIDDIIWLNVLIRKSPRILKDFLLPILVKFISPITARISNKGAMKSKDLWNTMEQLKNIVNDYLTQWDEKKLDVVICPTFTFPAPLKDDPVKLIPGISYVAVHNLTNFPAGTVPVTVENDRDQTLLQSSYPSNAYLSKDEIYKTIKRSIKGAQGLPIGVQVVARPFQEELVMHVMQEIQKLRQAKGDLLFKQS